MWSDRAKKKGMQLFFIVCVHGCVTVTLVFSIVEVQGFFSDNIKNGQMETCTKRAGYFT